MEVELVHSKTGKSLGKWSNLVPSSTIRDIKIRFQIIKPYLYADRQAIRLEPRGKSLKDDETLSGLSVTDGVKLYFKDLGPQVGWTTVFLTEYAGPLVIYLMFYVRPTVIYGASRAPSHAANIACVCWCFHYAKRLAETVFVHRFSHATMPITNIFKNSLYYWGFAAFVAYFINHPLYSSPSFGDVQLYTGLASFLLCEAGNFSIHLALRNLRPAGSKVRRIPYAGSNPFTWLFSLVSCPNYMYEAGAWLSFSVMTQCLPALIFASAGFAQMALWAMGKHRNYKREFKNYPKGRKCIVPFIL